MSTDSGSLPGVSAVIPAYNYAHFLSAAIDSILQQDYPNVHIIVVDDGSKDNTAEVVAKYGDKVEYVYQDNAGLPASRNTGIRAAKTPFVAFLDADDLWLPNLVSQCIGVFADNDDSLGIVAGKFVRVDPEGKPYGKVTRDDDFYGFYRPEDIILKQRFGASAVMVRREVFDEVGFFDVSLTSSEDRDMWIRIGAKYKGYLTEDVLGYVRNHPNSMSKHSDRMKQNMRAVIRKARASDVIPKYNYPFWLRVIAFNMFQCAWMYFDERRYVRASVELTKSLLTWPFIVGCADLDEPPLFRIRARRRFLWAIVAGPRRPKNA